MVPALWRGGLMTLVMTVALALLQYLRLGAVLIESGPAALSLLEAACWAMPALLTVSLPTGVLVGALTVFREQASQGRWLGLRLCGGGLGRPGWMLVAVGSGLSVVSLTVGLWAGPAGLERLAGRLVDIFVVERLVAEPGRPVAVGPEVVVSAREARRVGEGLELGEAWVVYQPSGGGVVLARARRMGLGVESAEGAGAEGSGGAGRLEVELSEARLRWVPGPGSGVEAGRGPVEVEARQVRVRLGEGASAERSGHLGRWLEYVPALERLDVFGLLARARAGDGRALRALAKRLALGLAPLGFLLLAFPLADPCRLEGDGHVSWWPVLVALGSCGGYFGLMRAGELWGAAGGPWLGPLVLPVGVLGAWCGVLWWRLAGRW